MSNSSYIEKAKAGASKTMLKELPRVLQESAAIGENKYKYIKTCAVSKREVEQVRSQKAAEKGTFSKRVFLVSTKK